jgi:hypothetical protein
MSRSRRKPYLTDQQNTYTKPLKRGANKAIRLLNDDEAPANGKAYRKYSNSWDIRDWALYSPGDKKAHRK